MSRVLYGDRLGFDDATTTTYDLDYRVWIEGVDVSEYVINDSIVITLQEGNGFNSCSFKLHNANKCFQLTPANLALDEKLKPLANGVETFIDGSDQYNERAKKQLYLHKKELNATFRSIPSLGSEIAEDVYLLVPNAIIINKFDRVRVFKQNPVLPGSWLPAFTGYVQRPAINTNYINGSSFLDISCEDIRVVLKNSRISMSATVAPRDELIQSSDNFGILMRDMLSGSTSSTPLTSKNYEQIIAYLLLGEEGENNLHTSLGKLTAGAMYFFDQDENSKSNYIDHYKRSEESHQYRFPLPSENRCYFFKKENLKRKEFLNSWMNLCLYGYRQDKQGNVLIMPMSYREMVDIGKETKLFGTHAPENVSYHMLLPKGGTHSSQIVETHFVGAVRVHDFQDRFNLIQKYSSVIDYCWWVTAYGDIVFEFPAYDLFPVDFDYESILTVNGKLVDADFADESGHFFTALQVTHNQISTNKDIASGVDDIKVDVALEGRLLITNPTLVARFGLQIKDTSYPEVLNDTTARVLGSLEFNKNVMDAAETSMNFCYNPHLLPNKPIYFKAENRIGVTKSVTERISCSPSSSAVIHATRRLSKSGKFVFITGDESYLSSWTKAWSSNDGQLTMGNKSIVVNVPQAMSK